MGTLQIDMLGASFAIQAGEDDGYLSKLLGYYKGVVDDTQRGGPLSPIQAAIMSGISLCDALYKEKEKNARLQDAASAPYSARPPEDDETERITLEMTAKLGEALGDDAAIGLD